MLCYSGKDIILHFFPQCPCTNTKREKVSKNVRKFLRFPPPQLHSPAFYRFPSPPTNPLLLPHMQAAQALLVEVTKTAAKHRTISAWTTAVMGPDGDNKKRGGGMHGASARSLESMHARQDRATLLMTEKV